MALVRRSCMSVSRSFATIVTVLALFAAVPLSAAAQDLYWDSNGTTAGAGATPTGTWGTSNFWNSDSTGGAGGSFTSVTGTANNLFFVAGPSATSGNNAYIVSVSGSQTANGLTFQASGGSTLSGGTIGLGAGGITMNQFAFGSTNQGAVTFSNSTALVLTATQTWTNNSASTLTWGGGLNLGANTLTFAGSGNFTTTSGTLTGAGGSVVHNGSGTVILRAGSSYTGSTTISGGGTLMIHGAKSSGNYNLTNGILTDYFQSNYVFSSGLGSGSNQIQITGSSGFGGGNGTSQWTIGSANSVLTWGSTFFNPTTLRFLSSADNMGPTNYGIAQLNNGLNLSGSARTINVLGASGLNARVSSRAVITGAISGTAGSVLIKEGAGSLQLTGSNSYADGTTINNGMVWFTTRNAMPASGTVAVANGAVLGVSVASSATTWGSGTGNAGIAGLTNGLGGRAGGVVSFAGNSSLLLDVTGNTTESNSISNGGATNLTLIKQGASTLTLSGSNTYSGGTTLSQGPLAIGSDNALGTGTLTINSGTIQSSAATARTLANAVTIGSDFTVGGSGNLTFTNTGSSALGATRTITVSTAGVNATFAQGFSGAGAGITKAGAGTLTLTGSNTFTGPTTINAGTIALNNGGRVAGSAVTFGANNTGLQVIGGEGVTSIWNAGNGNFGTGANTYSNIQVLIDGAGTAGSAVVTNVNTLIWGRTAISSTMTLTNGGQMNVNGEVRIGNPYYNEGGGANLTIGGGVATSTFTGNSGQDFYIGYGERTGSKNNVVTVGSLGVLTNIRDMYVGHVFDAQNNANPSTNNQLLVAGGTASMRGITVGFANAASARSANANVVSVTSGGSLTSSGTVFIGRANVATGTSNANTLTVSGTGSSWNAGNQTVFVGNAVASAVSNSNVLTVADGGVLTNVSSLIIGFGTGTRTGNQVVLNGGTVSATTVTVNAGNSLEFGVNGGSLSGSIANSGSLTISSTVSVSLAGAISGTGGITQAGTGTTTLSGTNTFTGPLAVNAGTFQIGNGGGSGSISNSSPVSVASGAALAFNRSDAVSYSGTVSGAGGLTKFGNGTLTLGAANTYSGATTISSGTLATGIANAISGSSAITIGSATARGFLEIDHALTISSLTFTGSGGDVSTLSTGTVTFLSSTGTTAITVLGGSNAFHANATLSSPTLVNVADGAVFSFHNNLAGSASLTKSGSGTMWLVGDNDTLSGNLFVTGGQVNVGQGMNQIGTGTTTLSNGSVIDLGGQSFTDRIVVLDGTILNAGGTATTTTIAGIATISGSTAGTYDILSTGSAAFGAAVGGGGSIVSVNVSGTNAGGGQATFNGAIGALGNVVVNAGGTAAFASTVAGSVISHGVSTFAGGVLSGAQVDVQTDGAATFAGPLAAGSMVDVYGLATISGTVAGQVDVSGTSTFTSASGLTGVLNMLGGAASTLDNVASTITGAMHTDGLLNINGTSGSQTISGLLSGTGSIVKQGAGTLVVSGSNTFSGGFTMAGGTVQAGNANAFGTAAVALNAGGFDLAGNAVSIGTLTGSAASSVFTGVAGPASLVSNATGDSTFAGVISNGVGTVGFEKAGVGRLTFDAAQTYTGNTVISGGTLALSAAGTFANSVAIVVGNAGSAGAALDLTAKTSLTIGAGQTLKGIGTAVLGPSTALLVSGTFSPGNSPGLFTYDGGSTTLAGTTLMEITGTSRGVVGGYDAVNVINSGLLTLGGSMILDFSQAYADDSVFKLFDTLTSGSLAGTFGSSITVLGGGYDGLSFSDLGGGIWETGDNGSQKLQLTYTETDLTLRILAAVPEPGTLVLAGIGIAVAGWRLRRRRV